MLRGASRQLPTRVASSALVAALGCSLLAARPLLVRVHGSATVLVLLYVGLLVVGAVAAVPADRAVEPETTTTWSTASAIAVGIAVFAAGRLLAGGADPGTVTTAFVLGNTLAAVAEEAWFRRFCFGLLAPGGAAFAVLGSSVLFAVIHVPAYGWGILPLDLAAGCMLGWQRQVTGSWHASAVTHAAANLLVVL